jgi:hypothetical protein
VCLASHPPAVAAAVSGDGGIKIVKIVMREEKKKVKRRT